MVKHKTRTEGEPHEAEAGADVTQEFEGGEGEGEGAGEGRERRRWSVRSVMEREGPYDEVDSLVTAAAIGGTAAIIESELLPGILIGAGALLVGRMFPQIGGVVRPVLKGVIRAGFAVTDSARGLVAEAGEGVRDVMAEVQSERRRRPARTRAERVAGAEEQRGASEQPAGPSEPTPSPA